MSIQSEIDRIKGNIAGAYTAVSDLGGEVPESAGEQNSANLAAAIRSIPASTGGVPSGAIVIWSGAANAIPDGWALCDGQDGRPDLRGRFVLGAGDKYTVGSTGGSETVTLTKEQMPKHTHESEPSLVKIPGHAVTVPSAGSSSDIAGYLSSTDPLHIQNSGNDQPHNNMPPYYALCYIIKVEG